MATLLDIPEPSACLDPFPLAEAAEAVVQIGTVETQYHCAGTGRKVLFLGSHGTSDWTGMLLFCTLASRFRVIAPEPGAGTGGDLLRHADASPIPISAWLHDVIDGLGLIRPSIVADGIFALAALSFALTEPERVDRIVVVCRDLADRAVPIDMFGDALRATGHPVLLLRLDTAGDRPDWAPSPTTEVIDFLAAPSADYTAEPVHHDQGR